VGGGVSAADAGSRPGPGATALTGFLLRDLRGSLAMRSLWVFSVSLFLGITLIAACTGLLELVRGGLDAQQRLLFGGDVQVEARDVLAPEELDWLEANGTVSRLVELRTMLGTGAGDFTVVELQSVDDAYPLYGDIRLEPDIALADAVGQAPDGTWGAAFDPVLAEQLGVTTGDRVLVGSLSVELRALIREQPDRSFRADFRGPPLMLDEGALAASGLVLPTSVLDYEYRVRTAMDPEDWRDAFFAAFPDAGYEVDTLGERGEFVGEQLDRVASVLLLIGIATLLIGGLGVANSIGAYLQSKFRTLATLQSLGARAAQVSYVFIGQTVLVALAASAAGAFTGSLVAWLAAHALAARLPVTASMADLLAPALTSVLFGVLAALAFALPSLGRTLSMRPALLIRGVDDPDGTLPASYRVATLVLLVAVTLVLLVVVPDPLIGVAFVIAMALLLVALEGIVRLVRRFALWLGRQPALEGRFAARMALAGLHRPGTALRPMLLSLGTALTLLVASSVVIAATLHTLNDTVPSRAPALVFYDIQDAELADFTALVEGLDGYEDVVTTPFVLGRLVAVNGTPLAEAEDSGRALEANDEQKFSHRTGAVDNIEVTRGAWWAEDRKGPPLVAFEDREADQAGLEIGDRLTFSILGETVDAELAAIYAQARFETRFWLEALFSDGALDPFVTRHIGNAFLADGTDVAATAEIGRGFPSVVTLRTKRALDAARSVLAGASLALALVAAVSLAASVLVMASVVAVNRQRQVHEASVLHALGTRRGTILGSVLLEYTLLGAVLALFAALVGGLLGAAVVALWLELPLAGLVDVLALTGLAVAVGASALCLSGGAIWLVKTLEASPATLLRRAG